MHFSTSHPRLFPFLAISILLLVLAGLGSLFFEPAGWQYSDLRLVKLPADEAPIPQVIAAYTRMRAQTIDVRLDSWVGSLFFHHVTICTYWPFMIN